MHDDPGSNMTSPSAFERNVSATGAASYSAHGTSRTMTNGAARIFREFKWGLLTLFLLMVVVVSIIYEGNGKKKDQAQAPEPPPAPGAPASTPPPSGREMAYAGGFNDETAPPVQVQPQNQPGAVDARMANGSPWSASGSPGQPGIPSQPVRTVAPVQSPNGANQQPGGMQSIFRENQIAQANTNASQPQPRSGTFDWSRVRTSVVPAPVPAPEQPNAAQSYTVQSGDTLSGIAAKYYPGRVQTGVKLLAEANKHLFTDPRTMREGMVLAIPAAAAASTAAPVPAPASTSGTASQPAQKPDEPAPGSASDGEYVVQSGDTLERIARKLLNDGNRWNDLYEWNRDRLPSPGRLQIGQKLRVRGNVPASASARNANETDNAVEIITPQPRVTAGAHETHDSGNSEGERTDTAEAAPASSFWMP